jgi:AhpD family alkylhydroperoxidase
MERPFTRAANDVVAGLALVREPAPAAMKAFGSLVIAATAPKVFDTKTKELTALAISVAVRCGSCVAYHTRASLKAGAGREEIAETVALAVNIGGRPAAVYGADALQAFDEYVAQASE